MGASLEHLQSLLEEAQLNHQFISWHSKSAGST